ncbi:hypothetical protein [Imbroritus primus]|uniref:hypothetical protein n=1 Tax=Imbroritus primus TaxID=3058603 RepID=UPI003D16184D
MEILIAAAVITAAIVYYLQRRAQRKQQAPSRTVALVWPSPGAFSVRLAEDATDQPTLARLAGDAAQHDTAALLLPIDDHPADARAIRVEIAGQAAGYLLGNDARNFRRRLQHKNVERATTQCMARIVLAPGTRGADGKRELLLDLKPLK